MVFESTGNGLDNNSKELIFEDFNYFVSDLSSVSAYKELVFPLKIDGESLGNIQDLD
jgi:hypothetical protein